MRAERTSTRRRRAVDSASPAPIESEETMHQKMQRLVKAADTRAPCPQCGGQPHEWREAGWSFLECSPCHARTPRTPQPDAARAMWDAMAQAGA